MRTHSNGSGRPGRLLVPGVTMAAALIVTLAACSSPASTSTHVTSQLRNSAVPSAAVPASAPASAAAASAAPAASAAGGLSGTWSGQYGGAFQGTFTLHWLQSGSQLSGSIQLSNPGNTLSVHGSVAGGSIRFGTVGSGGITYSGTVSGNSMSGTYQVQNGTGAGGNWSAAKS